MAMLAWLFNWHPNKSGNTEHSEARVRRGQLRPEKKAAVAKVGAFLRHHPDFDSSKPTKTWFPVQDVTDQVPGLSFGTWATAASHFDIRWRKTGTGDQVVADVRLWFQTPYQGRYRRWGE